jgi:hypothetical protein
MMMSQNELKKRKINLPIIAVSANDDTDTSSQARQLSGGVLSLTSPAPAIRSIGGFGGSDLGMRLVFF